MLKAVEDYQTRRQSDETPQSKEPEITTSTGPTPTTPNLDTKSNSFLAFNSPKSPLELDGSFTEVRSNGSTGSFGFLGASEESIKEFESPKLER